MTKLRNSTKKDIIDKLEDTYFAASSFDVKFHEGKKEFLEITFLPNTEFKYKVTHKSVGRVKWAISQAPGIHLREAEVESVEDFDDVIYKISGWSGRILEDFRIAKEDNLSDFEEFQKIIDEKILETENDKAALFDTEEVNSIKDTLDTLYSKFEELSKENDSIKKKLTSIENELNSIKDDLDYFPKNTWYRVSGSKIMKMVKTAATSAEGRKLITEAAKKYILGS